MPSRYVSGAAKRAIDLGLGLFAFLVTAPVVAVSAAAVYLADPGNPFYLSNRVGLGGRPFRLFKIRTMVVGAASSGVDTTLAGDPRLLPVGKLLRRLKIDELPQFLNVVLGNMSLVGPRPNVEREVRRYTIEERALLKVRPGVTDFASIVFSDLADALPPGMDANLGYNQYVRPWKSRLGLHYVAHASLGVDAALLACTAAGIMSRGRTLGAVQRLLLHTGAPEELRAVALRRSPLVPAPPPGAASVVSAEDLLGRDG
jgi:lipopolysaccharide/colanic/teichoic acid biosynthesis glycosyltransferase